VVPGTLWIQISGNKIEKILDKNMSVPQTTKKLLITPEDFAATYSVSIFERNLAQNKANISVGCLGPKLRPKPRVSRKIEFKVEYITSHHLRAYISKIPYDYRLVTHLEDPSRLSGHDVRKMIWEHAGFELIAKRKLSGVSVN
jgi:hypothetical protein